MKTVLRFTWLPLLVGQIALAQTAPPQANPQKKDEKGAPTTIRIRAGDSTPYKDSNGNVWEGERGFEGGMTISRDAGTKIEGTKDPALFLAEHYSMESFSCKVPNGKYIVKLYFAETFEGITGPGQRVFTFKVQGKEFKDFDLWKKAGGPYRVYVETVPVEITKGEFRITFTHQVENPEINAIEIIPDGAVATPAMPQKEIAKQSSHSFEKIRKN